MKAGRLHHRGVRLRDPDDELLELAVEGSEAAEAMGGLACNRGGCAGCAGDRSS